MWWWCGCDSGGVVVQSWYFVRMQLPCRKCGVASAYRLPRACVSPVRVASRMAGGKR